MSIQFPAKADFVITEGTTLPVLEVSLVGADGKVLALYGVGATVKFYMMPENSAEGTTPTVDGISATILTDPTFTADATTNTFTAAAHGLMNNSPVLVKTTTTLPAGLDAYTAYYVINAQTNTFQLSTTPNGTAVDITSAGTGTHTLVRGRVKHTWTDTHTATSGKFWGYFIVTYSDATTLAVPSDDVHPYIFIRISQKIG